MLFPVILLLLVVVSCKKEIRNIAEPEEVIVRTPLPPGQVDTTKKEVVIKPWDITKSGFGFLEKIQGYWVGKNRVIADDFEWFGWDFRPISASHVFGIFEGGSMGNLLNSFFVTKFKETRTIMARNGGVLNGIYRSSYFVLDSVRISGTDQYYRFVDANGGDVVMSMELRFVSDSLYFNAYTSGLGRLPAARHMTYKAKRKILTLANTAGSAVGFPKDEIAWDFSTGFVPAHLNGSTTPKSATYLAQSTTNEDVFKLSTESGDPFTIASHPYLGLLNVKTERDTTLRKLTQFMYVSEQPLVDASGNRFSAEAFDRVLRFPELTNDESSFLFTYMHPGDYYVTVVIDVNQDGFISAGDVSNESFKTTVNPENLTDITVKNIWLTIK